MKYKNSIYLWIFLVLCLGILFLPSSIFSWIGIFSPDGHCLACQHQPFILKFALLLVAGIYSTFIIDYSKLNKTKYLLSGIILLALLIGFWNLQVPDINFDESASLLVSGVSLGDVYKEIVILENNPPLYGYLLHFWMGISTNIVWLRSLSVIFLICTAVLVYLLTELLVNKQAALVASFLTITSSPILLYAQSIRNYSLMLCLSICSLYCFVKYTKNPTSKKWMIFYAISVLLGMYTTYFFVFVVGAQIIFLLLNKVDIKAIKHYTILYAVLGICYLPWMPFFLQQFRRTNSSFWIAEPTILSMLDLFLYLSSGKKLAVVVYGIAIVVIVLLILKQKRNKTIELCGVYFLLPIIAIYIISVSGTSLFLPRYFNMFLPGLFIIVGLGISMIKNKVIKKSVISLIILITALNLASYYQSADTSIQEINAFIDTQYKNQDVIVHMTQHTFFPEQVYNGASRERVLLVDQSTQWFVGKEYVDTKDMVHTTTFAYQGNIWLLEDQMHSLYSFEQFKERSSLELVYKAGKLSLYRIDNSDAIS